MQLMSSFVRFLQLFSRRYGTNNPSVTLYVQAGRLEDMPAWGPASLIQPGARISASGSQLVAAAQ
jgi:hypothetical protein